MHFFLKFTKQLEGDILCPPVPVPASVQEQGGLWIRKVAYRPKRKFSEGLGKLPNLISGVAASELREAKNQQVTPFQIR